VGDLSRSQKVVTWVALAIALATLFYLPVGYPGTYGRVEDSHYTLYWDQEPGNVADTSRMWMQFLVIAGVWAALFFSLKPRGE